MTQTKFHQVQESTDGVTDPMLLTGEKGGMTVIRIALAAAFIIVSGAVGLKIASVLSEMLYGPRKWTRSCRC